MSDTPHTSSDDASSTSPPDDSSAAPASASPSAHTKSLTSELLRGLDLGRLSPRSKAILIRIAEPVSDGFRESELAQQLGRTPSWVSERLAELKQEILLQNGIFPPLTEAEYAALRDSVSRHGVQQPVLLGEHVPLVDGHHRLMICNELAIPCPALLLEGLTEPAEHELAIALNASRRQLNRQQKRKLIEVELMRDPRRSDRRIAAVCGVSGKTVADVRQEVAAADGYDWVADNVPADEDDLELTVRIRQLQQPDVRSFLTSQQENLPRTTRGAPLERTTVDPATRLDTRGRQQPARRPRPEPQPRVVDHLDCPACEVRLQLIRHPDRHHELKEKTDDG